jgi:hypothetical protein
MSFLLFGQKAEKDLVAQEPSPGRKPQAAAILFQQTQLLELANLRRVAMR